jgi:DNA sulfur modification protein DndC
LTEIGSEGISKQDYSVFNTRTLDEIYQEIQEVYKEDVRPWIIGYSGGKDSTTSLQLVWYALSKLNPIERKKPVYVICSDTLVETPLIFDRINESVERINQAAKEQGLPITATKLYPKIEESFWVNLIGRGYPTPSKAFRWCTDRLKIKTADRFILQKASDFGEIILILGVRKGESATRAQLMNLYKIKGSLLSRHSKFSQSFVYTPIEDFTKDDVWSYLLQNPNPWNLNNRDLLALYRSADSGECPLVVDEVTPPCGNSRFGCWVCTVVTKDKAVQALIDNGEEWLEPMLEYRDMLAETQVIENKHIYREYRRLNGKTKFKEKTDVLIRGPYKFEYSQLFLKKLLETQKKVRDNGPNPHMNLILPEELHEIRRIWRMSRGDWNDTLPQIYREVMGEDLNWTTDDIGSFSSTEHDILQNMCSEHDIPLRLVTKLLDIERQFQGMKRRSSIYTQIESVLSEEWKSEEEVLIEQRKKLEKNR